MISNSTLADPLEHERLLVIGHWADGGDAWLARFAVRHPDWAIARCESYLSGIAELARRPARAVVAMVDASQDRLGGAVAGLREAGGAAAKVVLCCAPEAEPLARAALARGADEYLIGPPNEVELDAAIGAARSGAPPLFAAAPAAGTEELSLLGDALAALGARPGELIQKLADLVRAALGCRGATVVVEGAAATSGEPVVKPVLAAAVVSAEGGVNPPLSPPAEGKSDRVVGQVLLTERKEGPYTTADVERINHYARLFGHLIAAAERHREWRKLALTDACSGLPNRRYLHERLAGILRQAAAEQFAVTVLLFDVDDFKSYNDRYGHDAGDEIIRMTGELFRRNCREQDIVTRYGGDEFAVVFWDAAGPREAGSKPPREALVVLDRFTAALRTLSFPRLGPGGVGRLTISGGLATFPWDGATAEALISKADEALLAAKRAGKNRIFLVGHDAGANT